MNRITRRWGTVAAVSFLGFFLFSACSQGTQHNKAATPAAPASNETSCVIADETAPESAQEFGILSSHADEGEIHDTASLWAKPDGTLRVTMTQGDDHAVLTLNYCFRTDGTLAASVSTLGAVSGVHPDIEIGPVSQTTRRTFDRCGAQVAE